MNRGAADLVRGPALTSQPPRRILSLNVSEMQRRNSSHFSRYLSFTIFMVCLAILYNIDVLITQAVIRLPSYTGSSPATQATTTATVDSSTISSSVFNSASKDSVHQQHAPIRFANDEEFGRRPNSEPSDPSKPNAIPFDVSSYSFTVSGRYISTALPVEDRNDESRSASYLADWNRGIIFDEGKVRAVLLTRQSAIRQVRLASVRIEFESLKFPERRKRQAIQLSGLDLRDVTSLTFQGSARASDLGSAAFSSKTSEEDLTRFLPKIFQPESDFSSQRCRLIGTLSFDRNPPVSLSARPVDVMRDGPDEDWGFDESLFDQGGDWEQRNRNLKAEESDAPVDFNILTPPVLQKDLKGIIVSPDCGIRIIMSANEVDLISLGARVVHFACFFVLKSLLEARFFLAQARYTDSASSTPQKVSAFSLGLNTCVDCFEAIILLTEAVSANFMTSTFVVLVIFKMMFVSIVELRYLIIVLKSRYADADIKSKTLWQLIMCSQELPKLVKLHALGSAFMLIVTLKLMPALPVTVAILFLFWIPQIVSDIWTGNRRSLSLEYVVGMSVCRVCLPLYLWSCPARIFDGVIFKSAPGSPSLMISAVILFLVLIQVAIVLAQYIFGPRCFVPLFLLPNVYNYYRTIPKVCTETDPRGASFECVICMTDVSYISKTLVTSPCEHRFHETCLQQWMDVKPECPTCRAKFFF